LVLNLPANKIKKNIDSKLWVYRNISFTKLNGKNRKQNVYLLFSSVALITFLRLFCFYILFQWKNDAWQVLTQ
jgi:hypothetical protein